MGGVMPPTGGDALRIGRHQRHGYADILLCAQQTIGIMEFESQSDEGRHRAERDIALRPVEHDPDHALAAVLAPAHHPAVDHGGRIGARFGTGKAEARYLAPVREARQIILLLCRSAEMPYQLARPERIRHHHGDRSGEAVRRELADDFGMCGGGEAETTILLRDDHAEEAVLLDERPGGFRQVEELEAHLPIVDHPAQLLHRPIEKCPLLVGELGGRYCEQLPPVGDTGEQGRVPPHVARLDGNAFGLRHAWQCPLSPFEDGRGEPPPAKCPLTCRQDHLLLRSGRGFMLDTV